ncbi:MAG: DUF4230 domain-containing protein [Selenomonadaceae bacterium]|nr:DUF4230 domain-containing protein [Selenomonadaceae bacterium]
MFEMMGATFGATLAGCLALVGATGAAVYFFMRRKHDEERHEQEKEQQKISFQQMQTIVSEEIKNVHELVTVRKKFTSVISFADDKKIPLFNVHMPGSERKFLMDYSGMITCGCDLEAIRFERDEQSNRVKIIVPPSRIFDIYADINSFKIHHQSEGIFADNIKSEHRKELIAADLEAHRQLAVKEGILEQADENIRQMLASIIAKRGLNQSFNVEIVFRGNRDTRVINSSQQNLLR